MIASYLGIKPKLKAAHKKESDYSDLFSMFNVREESKP